MNNLKILALSQKEDARHGKAVFPLQKYMTQLDTDHPVVTTHWHDEAELTMVLDGAAEYQIFRIILYAPEIFSLSSPAFCTPLHWPTQSPITLKPTYFT